MEISGLTAGSNVNVVDRDKTGFSGLSANSFLKLLVTQLQNQDPTEPLGNGELLNQLSSMRSLQSNIELGDALKSITVNQQLSTSATFIGKSIEGFNLQQEPVSGIADRAFLKDGQAFVGIGDQEVPMSQIVGVTLPDAG